MGLLVDEDVVFDETDFSTICWQDKPRSQTGGVLVGDVPETILPLVLDRLRILNEPPNTWSEHTDAAIMHCKLALESLTARRADRDERGVTGTYTP
jgi:hypothetical protein